MRISQVVHLAKAEGYLHYTFTYMVLYFIVLFIYTGPKGVIHDWRKFKLVSEDQEAIPPNKKEILRQMSSPYKSPNKEEKDTKEKFTRKVIPIG